MKIYKLSEILGHLPEGIGLFIGSDSKKFGKKYCIGQPQLKNGQYDYFNSILDGLEHMKKYIYDSFPTLIIDCEN